MTNKDSICLEDNKNKKTTQERGDEERRKTRQQQQQPRCVFEEKKERRNRIHPSIQYQEKNRVSYHGDAWPYHWRHSLPWPLRFFFLRQPSRRSRQRPRRFFLQDSGTSSSTFHSSSSSSSLLVVWIDWFNYDEKRNRRGWRKSLPPLPLAPLPNSTPSLRYSFPVPNSISPSSIPILRFGLCWLLLWWIGSTCYDDLNWRIGLGFLCVVGLFGWTGFGVFE